jgi:hypothetical protein
MRDTIEMAREALLVCYSGPTTPWIEDHDLTPHLKAFEALVRADEREACAKVCESEAANPSCLWEEPGCWSHAAENCAGSIRARGEIK